MAPSSCDAGFESSLVVEKMSKAGLSSRLLRLVQAIQISAALKAVIVVPPPCKSLGGHGEASCKVETWNGYIDTDAFAARTLSRVRGWSPPCGGLFRAEAPASEGRRRLAVVDWLEASRQRPKNVTWVISKHHELGALARRSHVPSSISEEDLHGGNFPVAKEIEETVDAIVATHFQEQEFWAVKIRRTDKLRRGFENCTDPEQVATQLERILPSQVASLWIMSDEKNTSRYWSRLRKAIDSKLSTRIHQVLSEVDLVETVNSDKFPDNYAKYLLALAVSGRAAGIIATQNHARKSSSPSRPTFYLCQDRYIHPHR